MAGPIMIFKSGHILVSTGSEKIDIKKAKKWGRKMFVYVLTDPRDKSVRYVGISKTPEKRYAQHLTKKGAGQKKNDWIAELDSLGLAPGMTLIDEVYAVSALRKEREWISHYRALGCNLTNGY